jgi:hypothetical protein
MADIESLREASPGYTLIAAWAPRGHALVNHATYENGKVACVLGINGRGTLQVTEEEFLELHAAMVEAVAVLKGKAPTSTEDTSG